jgi:hypothetical protein
VPLPEETDVREIAEKGHLPAPGPPSTKITWGLDDAIEGDERILENESKQTMLMTRRIWSFTWNRRRPMENLRKQHACIERPLFGMSLVYMCNI